MEVKPQDCSLLCLKSILLHFDNKIDHGRLVLKGVLGKPEKSTSAETSIPCSQVIEGTPPRRHKVCPPWPLTTSLAYSPSLSVLPLLSFPFPPSLYLPVLPSLPFPPSPSLLALPSSPSLFPLPALPSFPFPPSPSFLPCLSFFGFLSLPFCPCSLLALLLSNFVPLYQLPPAMVNQLLILFPQSVPQNSTLHINYQLLSIYKEQARILLSPPMYDRTLFIHL